MNEENEGNMMQSQQQENQREQASDRTKEMGKKVAEKATKKLAGKGSLMAPLAHIIMIVAPILIAIIIIVGIIVFLLTMPGMVMDQLKAMFLKIGNSVAAFFGADTTKMIEDSEIYDTLDYLEKMGYDLKGFGFLTEYITNLSDADYDDKNGAELDTDMGVVRDDDGNIIAAKSDFIYTYIVSDNYVYTLKNKNIATLISDPKGWVDKISNYFIARATGCYKVLNFIAGPLLDKLGVTDAIMDTWGSGLIVLYKENGDVIGERGDPLMDETLWNWDTVSIDASKKALSIKRRTFLNNNNAMDFSLDGWTGRYGMPLEFLLSVHVATMMPDLAYDMATSFATNVNIYLHKTTSGTAITAYKSGDKYITYGDLEEALSGTDASEWYEAAASWFDDLIINDDEASKALATGIQRSPECTCDGSISITFGGYPCVLIDGSEPPKYSCTIPSMTPSVPATTLELSDSEVTKTEKICDACKKHIKKILKLLRKDNDYDFQTYIPYIASVTNHWYRDVYFVEDDEVKGKFIDYDYDYEAVTRERWTLYETYDSGERKGDFKLYKVDENGNTTNELYDGTREEAQEKGIAVAKKAKTIEGNEETYEDYSWQKNATGRWVAYEADDSESEGQFERLYQDDEIEEDDEDADIKKNLYVKVSTAGNAVQKGEGLRTETNSTIKKMFLQNQYYKYDGTAETAEVITRLREKGKYGALDEGALKKEIEVTNQVDGESKTSKRKASEVSGRVSLNQDSLNAFSMLENTHTMDADFIYRDFKELIVELGYFEKEELTDETPRLLQWIIPEINSAGFPNRAIDKNENEFGTMVHSEGDIKANEKNTIAAKLKDFLENETEHEVKDEPVHGININEQTMAPQLSLNMRTNMLLSNTVGALDGDVSPESVSVQEFLDAAADIHSRMEGNFWEYCAAGTHSGSAVRHTGDGSCPGNYSTFESSNSNGKTADCSSYVSWVLQEVGIIKDKYTSSGMYTALAEYILTREEAGELKAGDIVLSEGHVQINGENNMQYNAGSTDAIQQPPKEYFPDFYTHVIRLPFNGSGSSKKGQYGGYKGNEAVVSPVTGILLDYGTYDGVNDKSSITDELYRQNVDLKYQKTSEETGGDGGEKSVVNPEYDPSKPDLVGYAKILVLDAENYKKLEANSGTNWASKSLVTTKEEINDSGNKIIKAHFDDDDSVNEEEKVDELSEIEKTVYGYKEFAESYEIGGISGYVVYIDGFECYKPDKEFTEEQLETESPSKDDELKITLDSFKKVTVDNVESAAEDDELKMDSSYKKDEVHKMASKKATEKLKATAAVKEKASSTMYVNDLIFIKEGTVIGRTITDFQLIEEYRGESYATYRTPKDAGGEEGEGAGAGDGSDEEEEDTDAVIGNYLRIILRDTDDSVVEDVENYMKIDEGGNGRKQLAGDTIEEKVWLALLDAGYSEIAAAGVMGNIYGESGFNPAAIEGGSGEGHGLCQWSFGRKEQLFAFAAARGVDWTDEDLQIEFLLAELTPGGGADGHASYQFSGYEDQKNKWENASNIEDATTAFCAGFERPGVPRHQERIDAAQKYYDMYAS